MAAEKDDSRIVPVHFCRVTVIFRCTIILSLIINGLRLKRQTAQKFTCFFAKNRRFNVFFHRLSPNRGEKGKYGLFRPRLTSSTKIGHIGVYFAKTGCKIEDGFADIFGVVVRHLGWADGVFCLTFAPGPLKVLQTKEKMAGAIFIHGAAISFLPLF